MKFTRTSRVTSLVAVAATVGAGLLAFAPSGNAANSVADPHNIVVNSNFAAPAVTASSGFNTYSGGDSTSIPHWTVGLNSVDLNNSSYLQVPPGDPSSVQTIDLSGLLALGSVSQTLATQAGVHYTGSFELAANVNCGTTLKTGTLSVGSLSEPFSFDATGKTSTNMGWTQVNFAFVAGGTSTPITFASTTAGGCGPVITDVVVDPPLPPTITTNPNILTFQTVPGGAPVGYTAPTATDPNTGSAIPVTCVPASGSTFPVATTTVTCTATEPEGLSVTSKFTVKVVPVVGVCRATPFGLSGLLGLSTTPGTANAATTPCKADSKTVATAHVVLSAAIPLLGITASYADITAVTGTTVFGGGGAKAQAAIAKLNIVIGSQTISATDLLSNASAQLTSCTAPATLAGDSSVETLTVNGKAISPAHNSGHSVNIPLIVGSLVFNSTAVAGNKVTQTAFELKVGSVDLILGQAVAGVSCGS